MPMSPRQMLTHSLDMCDWVVAELVTAMDERPARGFYTRTAAATAALFLSQSPDHSLSISFFFFLCAYSIGIWIVETHRRPLGLFYRSNKWSGPTDRPTAYRRTD